jgi:hypothetical protein
LIRELVIGEVIETEMAARPLNALSEDTTLSRKMSQEQMIVRYRENSLQKQATQPRLRALGR